MNGSAALLDHSPLRRARLDARVGASPSPVVLPSPLTTVRLAAGLRLHPVPERNMCLVLSPFGDAVHTLDRSAWRLIELCVLTHWARIESAFLRSSPAPREAVRRRLLRALGELRARGLVFVETSGRAR